MERLIAPVFLLALLAGCVSGDDAQTICHVGDHTLSETEIEVRGAQWPPPGCERVPDLVPSPCPAELRGCGDEHGDPRCCDVVYRCEPNGQRVGDIVDRWADIVDGTVTIPTPGRGTPMPDFIFLQ